MKIAQLLDLWRKSRDPEVAELILAAEPQAKSVVAFEAEKKGGLGGVLKRMEAFDAPADPRVGRFLLTLIERYRPWDTPRAREVHERAFALLAVHADAAIVERLVRLADTDRGETGLITTTRWFETEVRKTIKALGRTVPKPDPAAIGLPALKHPPKPPRDRRAALFSAVYEAPDDDAPRAVLSDFLQQEGDPHGELIALQLSAPTPASQKRARTLLREHASKLVDPLVWRALMPRTVTFERGFVATGEVRARSAADFDRAIGAAAWATVHSLTLRYFAGWNTSAGETSKMIELLTHPAMRHVKTVGPIGRAELVAIVHHSVPLPWRKLSVEKRTNDASDEQYARAKKRIAVVFPKLEEFSEE